MGWLIPSPEEQEEIRGIPDTELSLLSTENLICIALARALEGMGIVDDALIEELYKRGGKKEVEP